MIRNNNYLESNNAISATYGAFFRSYKPPGGNVLFPHFPTGGFFFRRDRIPTSRQMGMAILSFVFLLFPSPTVRAEALSLEQMIAKTQEIYEKTTDLKAGFIQEVTIKSMKKTEREEGIVYFKNPRMMLWDYTKPMSKKLVINAQKAWLYVPEDRMVYVQNAEDVYRSRMAVKFLSGIGKLSEDFQIRFSKDNPLDGEGNYHLVRPKNWGAASTGSISPSMGRSSRSSSVDSTTHSETPPGSASAISASIRGFPISFSHSRPRKALM
jgi:outer membrane lipoprotein-sorting protein